MYKFSQEEALQLAAFSRYLRIIIHCLWIFCLSVLIHLCVHEQKLLSKVDILIALVCALVVPWSTVSDNVTRETIAYAQHVRAPYQQIANQIEQLQGDNDEGLILHVICSDVRWCEHLVLGYSLRPHRFEWNYSGELTTEEWLKEIDESIDYVVLFRINDEFIQRFPDGYETFIEQGGSNVSGGQKQRLCIARALLKKPKILILDDSTSAVDTATDAKIRSAFLSEIPDTTKIIIAQRISSVMSADRIIVMEDGKINGFGTHEELLASNEVYKDVYESQTGGGSGDFDENKEGGEA
jgi:ABC-type glutathione transport system ATPase component